MTQVFGKDGELIAVTVVELGPCTVVQKKTAETDGYDALQLGFSVAKPRNMRKPLRGHFEKKGLPLFTHVKEFRTADAAKFNQGEELFASGFAAGDTVHVSGVTKGRGFQGVMKRHGKHGGPASHGSDFHRRPGSIGMRTWPGHVLKNMKMPGHMGDANVTVKNLEVVSVRPDDNAILIRGALPGARDGIVEVFLATDDLSKREGLKLKGGKVEAKAEAPAETAAAEGEGKAGN
jgi:large subunit ribosomal protein L3